MLRLLCFLFLGTISLATCSDMVVDTPLGQVSGFERVSRNGRTYNAWTSIPYAKPPVGKLRLKAPKPIEKWEGVLNATSDMPHCIQNGQGQEDCLYLNVFRPEISKGVQLPVLFYVHGGGFQTGDMATAYIADYLMDEDVVLVCIHYRLNGFGFMTLGDKVLPGNFGLKDQVMALRWVNQYIKYFGGNPQSVTAFGTSAGGSSAHYLLKSPATENLLTRALSDSGTINHVWSGRKTDFVKNSTLNVANDVGCLKESSEEILKCLQTIEASFLEDTINKNYPSWDPSQMTFVPVVEPADAEDVFAAEDLSMRPVNKPWINSVTNGEWTLFTGALKSVTSGVFEEKTKNITEYLCDWLDKFVHHPDMDVEPRAKLLEKAYFDGYPRANYTAQFSKMHADDWFYYPAIYNVINHQGPKWFYHFEHKGEYDGRDPVTGKPTSPPNVAGHAVEGLFYFHWQPTPMNPADLAVSKRMIRYLVNFAYYSDPTPAGSALKWPQFENNEMLRVTTNGDFMASESYFNSLSEMVNTWVLAIDWQ